MNNKLSFLAILLALVALGMSFSGSRHPAAEAGSANDRVARTNILKCGYTLYPPYLEKDAKTGKLHGIGLDIIEAIAATLNNKIEWVEEVVVGTEVLSLEKGGIDAVCAITGGYDANNYERIAYSDYIFAVKNQIYARADDNRFIGPIHLEDIDNAQALFAGLDGDTTLIFPRLLMPNVKVTTLPFIAGTSQLFEHVKYRKADLIMIEGPVGALAMHANPGVFKILDVQEKLPTYAMQMAFSKKDFALKETINEAIRFMKLNGKFDPILNKYDPTGRIYTKMD